MTMHRLVVVACILWMSLSVGCAQAGVDRSVADIGQGEGSAEMELAGTESDGQDCIEPIEIVGPTGTEELLSKACRRFAKVQGLPVEEVQMGFRGVNVQVMEGRTRPPCENGSPGCAFIGNTGADVYVEHRRWRSYLPNLIYRILLVHFEGHQTRHEQNQRLRELSLCNGSKACGGFHSPCPASANKGGRVFPCNSLLN